MLVALAAAPWVHREDVRPTTTPVPSGDPQPIASAVPTYRSFPVSADAFIEGTAPDRNFGAADRIVVGGDPANLSAYRALLNFNLSAIPPTARIVDATLRVYATQGIAGREADVHYLRAPWVEGNGTAFQYRQAITVRETAGVARVREPVDLTLDLPVSLSTFVKADFRVYDEAGVEVPSQVYGAVYAGANVTRVHVVFGASVGKYGTRTYTLAYGTFVPLVPSFRTKALGQRLWTYPAGSKYAPLTAVDLNGDGRLEVLFASENGTINAVQWNGVPLWTRQAPDVVEFFSTAVDLNNDGKPEILYATTGNQDYKVHALDANGAEIWNTGPLLPKATFAPLAVSDTDGDGVKEIYFGATDGNLYAINGNDGSLRWRYVLGGGVWGYGGAVGNLTEGPEPEIVFTTTTGDFYAMRTDGTVAWIASPGGNGAIVTPSLGDFGTPGTLDVVAGDTSLNGKEFAFAGVDGSLIWSANTLSDQYGGQILVDFNGDGQLETVFAMTRRGALRALDSLGNTLWTFVTGDSIYGLPAAADVNLDGIPEVLTGSFDRNLYVIDSAGSPVATFATSDLVSATPIVADLDGDGTMEIVFSSRSETFAYSTGSLGHDFRTGAYNYNLTGRFLDGNSPDGVPFLTADLGPPEVSAGTGVTWRTRDGSTAWARSGSDYELSPVATATVPSTGWASWNVTDLVQTWSNGTLPNVGVILKARNESLPGLMAFGSREGDPAFDAILDVVYYENTGPKILARVPDQLALEDSPTWSLDLQGFAYDPDNPTSELRWDLGGVDASLYDYLGGNVTGNHVLRFRPKPNAYGNDSVTLFLFDPQGHYAFQPLWVNITSVNDPPTFNPPTVLYVKYGTLYTFDFFPYVDDVDTPKEALFLRTDDPVHTLVEGLRVTFTYPADYPNEWAFVVLTVDDGELSTSQSLAIRLTTDSPPVLRKPLPDVTIEEKQTAVNVFDLDDYFYDPDNDILFFSYGYTSLSVTIQPNHTVDMTALGDFFGQEYVTFRAQDPTGAIMEDTVLVTVLPVNDPPQIGDFPPFVIRYEEPYAFDLAPHLYDPDTPLEGLTVATSLPGSITVQGTVLNMLFPRVYGPLVAPYTLPLTIYVNDGKNTTSKGTTVTVGDDYPPALRPGRELPDVAFDEDTRLLGAFNLEDYFADPDGDTIFYWSGPVNVRVTIQANHSVDFNATRDWFGGEYVTFRASDPQGAYAEDTIRVTVLPVNDAPYFEGLPAVIESDTRTFLLDLRPYVRDVDSDTSSLRLQVIDPDVRAEGFVLLFAYPEGVREDTVVLTLSDGEASSMASLQVRIRGFDPFLFFLPWGLATAAAIATALAAVLALRVARTRVEHAFLIYRNGIMLFHLSPKLTADKDPDLIASMFTAIQSFMDESFHSMGVGELKSIELADHRVALVRGEYLFLVVLFRGAASGHVKKRATDVVRDIEKRYASVLKDWNGDVGLLEGAKERMGRLFRSGPSFPFRRERPAEAANGNGFDGAAK